MSSVVPPSVTLSILPVSDLRNLWAGELNFNNLSFDPGPYSVPVQAQFLPYPFHRVSKLPMAEVKLPAPVTPDYFNGFVLVLSVLLFITLLALFLGPSRQRDILLYGVCIFIVVLVLAWIGLVIAVTFLLTRSEVQISRAVMH
jgi:hypothetical protein